MPHIPVLLSSTLELLDPKSGEIVVDVTLGLGGHAEKFLEKIGAKGKLIGVDADEENLSATRDQRPAISEKIEFIHANFGDIKDLDLPRCDILFADLGLSSPHIDDPERGFSFRGDSLLDCRFDKTKGISAATLLKNSSENDLIRIFKEYAEVEKVYALAREISEAKKIETTSDLREIVEKVYKWKANKVLPQIFQAIRIEVNDEMGALDQLLEHGPHLLKPGGRMGIISYHSLEDRKVKQRFKNLTTSQKDAITGAPICPPSYELLTKKAVQANLQEIENNPRARSARLRVIKKI